jgi:hypothetical protein
MKGRFFIIVLVIGCFLSSCGTTVNIFDENLPLEASAILSIHPVFEIRTYNGIPVKLKTGLGMTGYTIPAGTTTLTFDLDTGRSFGDVRYRGKDFSLTYNFEAGNEYQITMAFSDKEGNYKVSSIGAHLALFLCQNNDIKKPLLVKVF